MQKVEVDDPRKTKTKAIVSANIFEFSSSMFSTFGLLMKVRLAIIFLVLGL